MPPSGAARNPFPSRARIALSLGALLALAAALWLVVPAAGSPPDNADPAAAGTSDSGAADAGPGTIWEPTTPDPDITDVDATPSQPGPLSPVRVSIPRIDVDSALVPLGLDPTSGALIPPERFDTAGYFTAGPIPGAVGPAVIAGHVDSRAGPAVFYRLEELLPGDLISVGISDGQQIDFRVVEVGQYPNPTSPPTRCTDPPRVASCG